MKKLAVASALSLLLSSCGRPGPGPSAPGPAAASSDPEPTPEEGAELIGRPAPAWASGKTWMNSEPLTLEGLRGKVVLIRFWTTGCPYCRATAPALDDLDARFRDKGLVVIGFHHPKSENSRKPEVVRDTAVEYAFRFPVAIDNDWEAVNRYWLETGPKRDFTSASFLIDRKGVIRWLHPGGEFHDGGGAEHEKCRKSFHELEGMVEKLLAES